MYTPEQTAAYIAARNQKINDERAIKAYRKTRVEPQYPNDATQAQRGFTMSGSAKLHFPKLYAGTSVKKAMKEQRHLAERIKITTRANAA